jgi:hypothetical protein
MRRLVFLLLVLASVFPLSAARPAAPEAPPQPPLPRDVVRYGPAYRYTQDGWIVVHVEGEPYARGYQQGRLLSKEIVANIQSLGADRAPKAPADGWKAARQVANALVLRKIDREFLEEMKGIADGAADAGATVEDRDVDLVDVVALNAWMEIDSLDSALDTMPTGLEGKTFPRPGPPRAPAPHAPRKDHCSAFIATAPATADGRIVFGHITMSGLSAGPFVNVWLDVQPKAGHRFVMQGFPGAVWSSQDYYINDAGILLCETTINQTPLDASGSSLVSRARKAIQYGESIDGVVKALSEKNNGLYANEWLIGDLKTNEIAMLDLGTKATRLWRSSKNQWFEGTKGFYWGCNNAKDPDVRAEALPADPDGEREKAEWEADGRDKAWLKFYALYAGKIDAAAAKKALTSPPLAAPSSLDAKYTTADLAKQLTSHAIYGPPHGKTWKPTEDELRTRPDLKPLEPHPWTLLTIAAPPAAKK